MIHVSHVTRRDPLSLDLTLAMTADAICVSSSFQSCVSSLCWSDDLRYRVLGNTVWDACIRKLDQSCS